MRKNTEAFITDRTEQVMTAYRQLVALAFTQNSADVAALNKLHADVTSALALSTSHAFVGVVNSAPAQGLVTQLLGTPIDQCLSRPLVCFGYAPAFKWTELPLATSMLCLRSMLDTAAGCAYQHFTLQAIPPAGEWTHIDGLLSELVGYGLQPTDPGRPPQAAVFMGPFPGLANCQKTVFCVYNTLAAVQFADGMTHSDVWIIDDCSKLMLSNATTRFGSIMNACGIVCARATDTESAIVTSGLVWESTVKAISSMVGSLTTKFGVPQWHAGEMGYVMVNNFTVVDVNNVWPLSAAGTAIVFAAIAKQHTWRHLLHVRWAMQSLVELMYTICTEHMAHQAAPDSAVVTEISVVIDTLLKRHAQLHISGGDINRVDGYASPWSTLAEYRIAVQSVAAARATLLIKSVPRTHYSEWGAAKLNSLYHLLLASSSIPMPLDTLISSHDSIIRHLVANGAQISTLFARITADLASRENHTLIHGSALAIAQAHTRHQMISTPLNLVANIVKLRTALLHIMQPMTHFVPDVEPYTKLTVTVGSQAVDVRRRIYTSLTTDSVIVEENTTSNTYCCLYLSDIRSTTTACSWADLLDDGSVCLRMTPAAQALMSDVASAWRADWNNRDGLAQSPTAVPLWIFVPASGIIGPECAKLVVATRSAAEKYTCIFVALVPKAATDVSPQLNSYASIPNTCLMLITCSAQCFDSPTTMAATALDTVRKVCIRYGMHTMTIASAHHRMCRHISDIGRATKTHASTISTVAAKLNMYWINLIANMYLVFARAVNPIYNIVQLALAHPEVGNTANAAAAIATFDKLKHNLSIKSTTALELAIFRDALTGSKTWEEATIRLANGPLIIYEHIEQLRHSWASLRTHLACLIDVLQTPCVFVGTPLDLLHEFYIHDQFTISPHYTQDTVIRLSMWNTANVAPTFFANELHGLDLKVADKNNLDELIATAVTALVAKFRAEPQASQALQWWLGSVC
jgi:hypothetical protein